MVSFSENDSPPSSEQSLPAAAARQYQVIVPVFMKVTLTADDELAAEVSAVEAIRLLRGRAMQVAGVVLAFQSVIAPIIAP